MVMSDKNRLFLLIEYFQNAHAYDFNNPIEEMITANKQDEDTLIILDNFSNEMTTSQVKSLIDNASQLVVVNYFKEEVESLGRASSILNSLIRKQPIFFSNQEMKALNPMMTMTKGQYFESEKDLKPLLFD